jgi:hypothetical protein
MHARASAHTHTHTDIPELIQSAKSVHLLMEHIEISTSNHKIYRPSYTICRYIMDVNLNIIMYLRDKRAINLVPKR